MSSLIDLGLIGRTDPLFVDDIKKHDEQIASMVEGNRFLVIGGAGSIGNAVVKQLFKRNPGALHVVDISENNLAELVRDIRSSFGYIQGDFRTYCVDCNSPEFQAMINDRGPYDYVLNFSALKHVRSEKDPFTLMRMIQVNIFGTKHALEQAARMNAKKYFCVSTDKAANPVNMMGASKRIMEMFLMRGSQEINVSSARFANVAFSDGSLPYAWTKRIQKRQPIVAPSDVHRYFVTDEEGALLCLLSIFLGENRDVFFSKLNEKLPAVTFSEIAVKYLDSLGYEAVACETEEEARGKVKELSVQKKWPCYFVKADTTGEKECEEMFSGGEVVDLERFVDVGIVKNDVSWNDEVLNHFENEIKQLCQAKAWQKQQLVDLFLSTLNNFDHKETFKYLDDRM